ncbi:MAG: Crp/Fnr family transcriptional regulator [Candidatus Sulfopaludibacter sp.]|nr:Crp/Fnr family transcriptional regulator [Candidatus Sulfopaludibacter sp.]
MPTTEPEHKPLLEEVLAYLPYSDIHSFAKGQQIYGPGNDSGSLCLLIEGRVKLLRLTESGVTVAVDIYQAGDLFGESALLSVPRDDEQALAVEPAKVMAWTAAEIANLIAGDPRLAVALMQVIVKRCLSFKDRLESLSAEDTSHRLGRALVDFADRSRAAAGHADVTIAPLTHELLAQYVGTSREIVSQHMSTLRRHGYIGYSRKGILVHCDTLRDWLHTRTKRA